jgi:hypothetical protein
MEHRGVRYEIKIAVGRSQWTWIAHTPPKPLEGSIEGAKRDAILAAEKRLMHRSNDVCGRNTFIRSRGRRAPG